jgi:hypothetical protein
VPVGVVPVAVTLTPTLARPVWLIDAGAVELTDGVALVIVSLAVVTEALSLVLPP